MRKMKKKSVLLLFISILMLTGCWSKEEINDRAFVTGIFIDQADKPDEVKVTIVTPLVNRMTQGQQGGHMDKNPYGSVSKQGKTIPEALHKIQADGTRKLTWGHIRIVVLGSDYAKKGIHPFLEWAIRQPSFLLKTYILIAPHKATEILRLTPIYEMNPTEVLREFSNHEIVLSTSIYEVIRGFITNQGSAVTMLTFGREPMISEEQPTSAWAGTNGAGLFQYDKMVGMINKQEAMMFAWLKGKLKSPVFILPLGPKKEKVSIGLEEMNSKIRPFVNGNRIQYRIELESNAHLISAEIDASEIKISHQIERELERVLTKQLKNALRKTQQAKADALQLGSRLEWWYPKKWAEVQSNWKEIYHDQVDFQVHTRVHLQHLGTEYNSLKRSAK